MAFGADCFLDCDRQGFKGQIKQTYPETLTLRSVKDDNYVCGKQVYFTQAPSVEGSHVRFQTDQIYMAYGPAYVQYISIVKFVGGRCTLHTEGYKKYKSRGFFWQIADER